MTGRDVTNYTMTDREASSEDRTRDLALTKRMLCQLSYRGVALGGAGEVPRNRATSGARISKRCADLDTLPEWLRGPPAKRMCLARRGSNPLGVAGARGIGAIGSVRR